MRIRIIVQKIKDQSDPFEPKDEREVWRDYFVDEENRFDIEKWGMVVDEMVAEVEDKPFEDDDLPF